MRNYSEEHEKYTELCALATTGALSASEWDELKPHLAECSECRQRYSQYCALTTEVIPMRAEEYDQPEIPVAWDDRLTRARLLSQVRREPAMLTSTAWLQRLAQYSRPAAIVALAACFLAVVGLATYRAGKESVVSITSKAISAEQIRVLSNESPSLSAQVHGDSDVINKLLAANATKQAEIDRLQTALHAAEARLSVLSASDSTKSEQLKALDSERDGLAQQLSNAQQSYTTAQEELATLRSEREEAVLRAASFESEVQRLTRQVNEKDEALRENEQFLASDRDIRELMGARQLYIADVFDIDNGGQTRKPYGRVFYTRSKSLIFYAFDLDQAPMLKNASSFQAWGRKDAGPAKPVSLGILYMDNEANRRWSLRFDDPEKLAQIDSIFVTIEPNGGSKKPTGRPFLYASLRHAANHP